MLNDPIYLDYAAATPLDEEVLAAMRPYLTGTFYNPSASYDAARSVRTDLEAARATVAHWLGTRPTEIIFTAGGTEANNLALHGIMRRFPQANLVVSAVEHESVLAPAARYNRHIAKVKLDGSVDLDDLRHQIDDQTVLVSIMYANNEVGTIQPLREVAKIIDEKRRERAEKQGRDREGERRLPLYLHTDACQAANYLDLHVSRLGVDLLTLNGGKIYGPKQSGALYVKRDVTLEPLIDGGGQERGLRSGTENVAAAIGLAKALDKAQTMRPPETVRLQALQRHFFEAVEARLPGVVINGSRHHRLPNNVHVTLPGQDNERLLMELDARGVQAAAGSACSASDETPSHVLRAMGLGDAEAQASLRFAMGRQTTEADIESLITALRAIAG